MQNPNEYLAELKSELNTLTNKYDDLQAKIKEESFSYELKRKNFIEVVSNNLKNQPVAEIVFQNLEKKNLIVDKNVINDTLRAILKI